MHKNTKRMAEKQILKISAQLDKSSFSNYIFPKAKITGFEKQVELTLTEILRVKIPIKTKLRVFTVSP